MDRRASALWIDALRRVRILEGRAPSRPPSGGTRRVLTTLSRKWELRWRPDQARLESRETLEQTRDCNIEIVTEDISIFFQLFALHSL